MLIYLLTINALAFMLMLLDKLRARKKQWRVPEVTLFAIAALGGSVGTLMGMYLFRHKTRHWYFVIGIPILLLAQTGIALLQR